MLAHSVRAHAYESEATGCWGDGHYATTEEIEGSHFHLSFFLFRRIKCPVESVESNAREIIYLENLTASSWRDAWALASLEWRRRCWSRRLPWTINTRGLQNMVISRLFNDTNWFAYLYWSTLSRSSKNVAPMMPALLTTACSPAWKHSWKVEISVISVRVTGRSLFISHTLSPTKLAEIQRERKRRRPVTRTLLSRSLEFLRAIVFVDDPSLTSIFLRCNFQVFRSRSDALIRRDIEQDCLHLAGKGSSSTQEVLRPLDLSEIVFTFLKFNYNSVTCFVKHPANTGMPRRAHFNARRLPKPGISLKSILTSSSRRKHIDTYPYHSQWWTQLVFRDALFRCALEPGKRRWVKRKVKGKSSHPLNREVEHR